MKGFLVLLVFSAAGLAGVLWWRQSLQAPRAPVVAAADPAKGGKERRRRHRHGARRLARNEVFASPAAAASPDEPPTRNDPSPSFDPVQPPSPREEERAPLAPGGAATTEVEPQDLFASDAPLPAQPPGGGGSRQAPEPEPIKLRAADLKIVWQGEDLSRPEVQRLDFSNDGGHELTENEIDARFRAKEDAVLGCIARARPDEYTDIPGRVSVRFRILRTGVVKGVQVEAPVILHKGGLTGCLKGVMGGLKFPASNASQVITYPFSLM